MKQLQLKEDNRGQAAIIGVIVMSAILLTVVTTILSIAVSEYQLSQNDILESQVKYLSESGIENALLQIGQQGTSYTGGSFVSPIDSQINATDNVTVTYNTSTTPEEATITSQAQSYFLGTNNIDVQRTIQVVADLGQNNPILNYSLFANNYITGEWFQNTGDIQSNNELFFNSTQFNSNNINAVGIGGGAGNIFNDVNVTNSTSVINLQSEYLLSTITDSNIAGELGCGITYWGVNSCLIVNSTIANQANLSSPTKINLPTFDLSGWKAMAQTNGTYFNSEPSFESFLQGYSTINDGVDTITPPKGLYYIDAQNANLPSTDSGGNPIVYNFTGSTIMTKNRFSTNASYIATSPYTDPSTGKYLPAIVSGNQGIYIGTDGGNANIDITGVLYSPGNIYFNNDIDNNSANDGNGTTTLNGALWAGGSININNLGYNDPNIVSGTQIALDPSVVDNTEGFNIVQGDTSVISWQEIN